MSIIYVYMRTYLSTLKKSAGFTLIELLVVIGILGILAAALIATIDPFEQLKKADDANAKNVAVEYVNGVTRYYTTHSAFPWAATDVGGYAACHGNTVPTGLLTTDNLDDPSMTPCITALTADNELKQGFKDAKTILKKIFITGSAVNNTVIACFKPGSLSGQKDPNAKFDQNGIPYSGVGTCKSNTTTPGTVICFWCAQ